MNHIEKKARAGKFSDIRFDTTIPAVRRAEAEEKKETDRAAEEFLEEAEQASSSRVREPWLQKNSRIPRIGLYVFTFLLIAAALTAFGFFRRAERARTSIASTFGELRSGVSRLPFTATPMNRSLGFVPAAGESSFGGQAPGFTDYVRSFFPLVRNGSKAISQLQEVAANALALEQAIGTLADDALKLVLHGGGQELVARLETVHALFKTIQDESDALAMTTEGFQNALPVSSNFFIPLRVELNRIADFLEHGIVWLTSSEPHRLIVLFQNSAELRPTGGFLGSYAEVTVQDGSIKTIVFHDVNDVDRTLVGNIVPPKPVQAIASRWKTADTNWFFNFPDSAQKTLAFMESSGLYKASSTSFDGVIAVTPKVIEDILSLMGPIELAQAKVTVDRENVVHEIQKSVQAGQAAKSQAPKKMLGELTTALLSGIEGLSGEARSSLPALIASWVQSRDVQVYFKNADFQKFFDAYAMTGRVFDVPQNFNGGYLAVVEANLGGGKSDRFMKTNVRLEAQIQDDGMMANHLTVMRENTAGKTAPWWYREESRSYFKVFTPSDAELTDFKGGWARTIAPPAAYVKLKYAVDPLVQSIEAKAREYFLYPGVLAFAESGKNVFGTWAKTPFGKKTELAFEYRHRLYVPPAEGVQYEFVLEDQAGTNRTYHMEISAPLGFRWQENKLPLYEYETDDLPGRVMLHLTLEKNQ